MAGLLRLGGIEENAAGEFYTSEGHPFRRGRALCSYGDAWLPGT